MSVGCCVAKLSVGEGLVVKSEGPEVAGATGPRFELEEVDVSVSVTTRVPDAGIVVVTTIVSATLDGSNTSLMVVAGGRGVVGSRDEDEGGTGGTSVEVAADVNRGTYRDL